VERLILVLIVAILGVHTPALAQLEAANEAGVSFGHWPATVRHVEATKKFWIILGGKRSRLTELM
jgi:hypothetical protein